MTTLRLWRTGMFAQMAALIALALMAAHIVGYFLILDQQQRANLVQVSEPGIARFAQLMAQFKRGSSMKGQNDLSRLSDFNHRFSVSDTSRVADRRVRRDPELEGRVGRALTRENVHATAIEAGFAQRGPRRWFPPPMTPPHSDATNVQNAAPGAAIAHPNDWPAHLGDGQPHMGPPGDHPPHDFNVREAVISARLPNGHWINVETFWRVPPPDFVPRVVAAEILLYCAILAAALFFARRIASPLKALADTSMRVGAPGPTPSVPLHGPAEVRQAIGSFNDMSARVAALLREKDEILGAIGHDLRTPIASLRLRAEGIVDPIERERFVGTLNDMQQLLEDALDMARIGQSSEIARQVDISALADSLIEDYRSRGHNVRFLDSPRAPILCKPALTRRMLRNLIDNAIKFGERAEVGVVSSKDFVRLTISDNGPGLPERELQRMLEPFVRLETSRNRATGGAGLGLAIAARIAAAENADLKLANRSECAGLEATLTWPQGAAAATLGLQSEVARHAHANHS